MVKSMKTNNRKGGYSANTANEYIDSKQAIYCLSTELETQIKFEDGQPTVSMGIYATALYVLGMLDRLKDVADIAFDAVGQALSSEELPKRIVLKKE